MIFRWISTSRSVLTGPFLSIFRLLFCSSLLALCKGGQNESQHGQHHGGDDVQCKGEGVLVVHTQHAAHGSNGKAPAAEELSHGLILDKAVLGRDGIVGVAQGDVGGKHPQVAHGHTHRVQLGQLAQNGSSTGHEGLCQNDGAGQHRHHLDAVAVHAVGVDLVQSLRDELLGVLVIQQHTQRCVDAQNQHGELADDVAQGVDDHEQIAHMVVLTQPLESPVGTVGNIGVEALCAGVDDGGVEHAAHGQRAQNGAGATFAADMTIMEEGSEFLERLPEIKESGLPMFTSCCPGWVKFVKSEFPEMAGRLSTAKSPQQMFGAITKSYYAEKLGVDPEKIFCVSIMPCLAKKDECTWDGGKDVDAVLTTREVERMFKAFFIKPEELDEDEFDNPLGEGTGAGVIFGATGGVMEAALRSAYYLVTGNNPDADAFQSVRGLEGWKEASFDLNGTTVNVAVASGLGNTRRLVNAIKKGEVHYDFVEIMSCPGGCINGGGQPYKEDAVMVEERRHVLYGLDKRDNLRFSHENPSVKQCYEEYFGKPLSHRAHEILHVK